VPPEDFEGQRSPLARDMNGLHAGILGGDPQLIIGLRRVAGSSAPQAVVMRHSISSRRGAFVHVAPEDFHLYGALRVIDVKGEVDGHVLPRGTVDGVVVFINVVLARHVVDHSLGIDILNGKGKSQVTVSPGAPVGIVGDVYPLNDDVEHG
jgi:hypothetical protein